MKKLKRKIRHIGKMKKIKFPAMPKRIYVDNYGFVSQWCCKCKSRHIWHFHICRQGKDGEKDFVEITGFQDEKANELRKFYAHTIKKKGGERDEKQADRK